MLYERIRIASSPYYELTNLLSSIVHYYNYEALEGVVYVCKGLDDNPSRRSVYLTSDISKLSKELTDKEYVYVKLPVITEHIDDSNLVERRIGWGKLEFGLEDKVKLQNLRHILDPVLKMVFNCDLDQYLDYLTTIDKFTKILKDKKNISNRLSQYTKLTKDVEIEGVYATLNNLLRKRTFVAYADTYIDMVSEDPTLRYDRFMCILNYKKGIHLLEQIN